MNNLMDMSGLSALVPALQPATAPGAAPAGATIPWTREEGAASGCYGLVISDCQYHRQTQGASSSSLKKLLRSPAHYQAYLSEVDTDSAARMFGRAVHALLLERPTFLQQFAVWTEGRRAGKNFETFELAHAGKTILTEEEHNRALEAAVHLRNSQDFPLGLWLDGVAATADQAAIPAARTEFSIYWIDEETGIQCKARIDAHSAAPTPLSLDVKTTDDVRPNAFMRQFMKLDYDLQAAHYRAALRALHGVDFPFLFAAVESCEPYATRIYGMSEDLLANGEAKRQFALRTLKKCLDTNTWPAYPGTGIHTLDLPYYSRFYPQE
jgi:hypothetical protein